MVFCDWLLSLSIMFYAKVYDCFLLYQRRVIIEPALNWDVLRFKRSCLVSGAEEGLNADVSLQSQRGDLLTHPPGLERLRHPRAQATARSLCACALLSTAQNGARKARLNAISAVNASEARQLGMIGKASSWAPCKFSWERALQTVN